VTWPLGRATSTSKEASELLVSQPAEACIPSPPPDHHQHHHHHQRHQQQQQHYHHHHHHHHQQHYHHHHRQQQQHHHHHHPRCACSPISTGRHQPQLPSVQCSKAYTLAATEAAAAHHCGCCPSAGDTGSQAATHNPRLVSSRPCHWVEIPGCISGHSNHAHQQQFPHLAPDCRPHAWENGSRCTAHCLAHRLLLLLAAAAAAACCCCRASSR